MEEKKLIKKKEKAMQVGNVEWLAEACNHLGDFFKQHGRYSDAAKEFEQSYNSYQKLGKRLEMAKASRMIGEMYMLLCEFEDALKQINIYLKIVDELKDKVEQQRALATLGRAHLLHGQSISDQPTISKSLKSAEKSFIKSLLISKELSGEITKLEQLDMQARLYLNIGVVKEHMEEFQEALLFMNRAIKISKSNDLHELLHLCYLSVCLLYQYKRNDYTKALSYCNLALDISERLPNKVTKMCQTLIAKAEIIISIGDFVGAKEVLIKAYKMKTPDLNDKKNIEKSLKIVIAICNIFETIQMTDADNYEERRKLFEQLGDGCCRLLNYEYAITYYLKTLECIEFIKKSDKDYIPIYVSLYQTYRDDKQYKEALEYLWKEYELNRDEPVEAFWTLCNIAEIFELQSASFWKLFEIYTKAIDQAKNSKKQKLLKIAYFRLMKVEKKFKMLTLLETLKDDAKENRIDLDTLEEENDVEETQHSEDQNTPDIGEDICLEELLDSSSESEEKGTSRSFRKRGNCFSLKRNNKGETQLHAACISGNIGLAQRLIDQGHDVNVPDYAGWLPLHEACNHGHKDIVELLLDRGAISAINDKGGTSFDGITPLYDACSNGFLEVATLLIDRGANTTLRTDFGDTALTALEKWRVSVHLSDLEQIQYESIRSKLKEQLIKLGIEKKSYPFTNDSIEMEMDNSIQTSNKKPSSLSTKRLNRSEGNEANCSNFEQTNTQPSVYNEYEKSKKRRQAEIEYKAVMESLKRPNRSNDLNDNSDMNPKRRSGYLDADEIDDDWLDDDLLPQKKKRKCNITSPTICTSSIQSKERSPPLLSNDCVGNGLIPYQYSVDAITKLLDLSKERKQNAAKLRLNRTSTITSSGLGGSNVSQQKEQSTLFNSGFCRFQRNNSLGSDTSIDNKSSDPDLTSNLNLSQTSPIKMDKPVVSIVSFKINVKDELLLVSVERNKINELNIQWLAEEASRRYYKIAGLKPILRLMTADGFAFEETDNISVALDQNVITSKVIEWDISPVSKRYQEISNELKIKVDLNICFVLEKSKSSKNLSLRNLSLTSASTGPLFKAIMYQSLLQRLDLTNNFIQDEGCKMLAKSLPTLPQLKVLNLKGNYITHTGLAYIMALATTDSVFEELEELTLNDNPIGNKGMRYLDIWCHKAKKLQTLNVCHCSITNLYDNDLSFYKLTNFNISFNCLTSSSFIKIMSKLNANHIKVLNISFTIDDETITRQNIYRFLMSGSCEHLKRLDLAGCNLIDRDVYKIVQMLSRCCDFQVLNLCENSKLTFPAFQYILKHLLTLKVLLLSHCKNILSMQLLDMIPMDYHIPEYIHFTLNPNYDVKDALKRFWKERWGCLGRIEFSNKNVILYTTTISNRSV